MGKRLTRPLAGLLIAALLLSPATVDAQQEGGQRTPQQPRRQPASPAQLQEDPYDDEVVRITTNLVQIDAVVTDKDGRQVTDLRPEDFEVLEDGKPRQITNFAYVRVAGSAAAGHAGDGPARSAKGRKSAVVAPPVMAATLRPEQVRRTVALVVDDICMSFEDVHHTKRALSKFLNEQVGQGDLVAVLRTSAGAGTFQQFTSDRRLLDAAIERIRWRPTCGSVSSSAPINPLDSMLEPAGDSDVPADNEREGARAINEMRQSRWASATLSSLNQIVQGLKELPGRKAVVLMSGGLPILDRVGGQTNALIMENVRLVVEHANRASVVIYTIDARGLVDVGLTAADNLRQPLRPTPRPDEVYNYQMGPLAARRNQHFDAQDGLIVLAERTGGFNVRNTNDVAGGITRAVEDQSGYYLIGYRPDEATFDPKTGRANFNRLSLRVRGRSGLRVRTRSGFFAIPEERVRAAKPTPADQLRRALVSPFTSADISVSLTSLFGNEPGTGSFIRSLLHFDARDLTFEEQPDGRLRASVDVLAVTADGSGQPVDQVGGTHAFDLRREAHERLLREGLDYVLNVPVKKPGAYQLRVAVRDSASGKVGSASHLVEVPDLGRGRLALSGMVVSGATQDARDGRAQSPDAEAASAESGPAVRRLRRGSLLDYGYVVYNARLDRATNRPRLTAQVFLFRDGRQVYAGAPSQLDAAGQADLKRIAAGGRLQLGANLLPGEYALQVVVTDAPAREKPVVASQWIDFKVVQ